MPGWKLKRANSPRWLRTGIEVIDFKPLSLSREKR
jgi:hypothetical protein